MAPPPTDIAPVAAPGSAGVRTVAAPGSADVRTVVRGAAGTGSVAPTTAGTGNVAPRTVAPAAEMAHAPGVVVDAAAEMAVSDDLAALLARGGTLVLTGAGVSTDSGIPDYRGPDGRARVSAPMTIDRFVGSDAERRRYWARSHLGWSRIAAARPNVTHRAVADLGAAGLLSGVVTQNVDGLHTAAGSRAVIDLHGRLDRVVCLRCGARRPRLEVGLRLDAVNPGFRHEAAGTATTRPDGDVDLPDAAVASFRTVDCRACGGVLKPDVVYFGEQIPRERFRGALGLLDRSEALVVLGSSLMVGSGYRFVTAAARRGLPIAIVTRGLTRGDAHATLRIDAWLADVMPTVAGRAVTAAPRTAVAAPRSASAAPTPG